MIGRFAAYMIGGSLAVVLLGELFQGGIVTYDTAGSVLLFGVLLGLINALIGPILRFLTMPLTCLTFGLFALVVNAALFALAAYVAPGVDATIWGIAAGSVVTSVIGGIVFAALDERR